MTPTEYRQHLEELTRDPLATLPGCVILEMIACALERHGDKPIAYMVSGQHLVKPQIVMTETDARRIVALGYEGAAITELHAGCTRVYYTTNTLAPEEVASDGNRD